MRTPLIRLLRGLFCLSVLAAGSALPATGWAQASEGADSSAAKVQVNIAGQVRQPGSVDLKAGATVLDAIKLAGGFADGAVASGVKVTRVSDTAAAELTVDCTKNSGDNKGETKTGNFPVVNGDIIFVP